MNIIVIGIGAAGNKATIKGLKNGILVEEDVILLNSTLRDIVGDYRSLAIQFDKTTGGCGKERDLGKNLCLKSFKEGTLDKIDDIITDDVDCVIIDNSTEGGTGSGAGIVVANYVSSVLGKHVICVGFTGFEDDGRGLQNTIEYFQDLKESYSVIAISNKKCLEYSNSVPDAEELANDDFIEKLSIIKGKGIVDSEQNIDETDFYKVMTTPGLMTIGKLSLAKIKNTEHFNKALADTVDNIKTLDSPNRSAKRIAVFVNVREDRKDIIDYSFSVLKNKLGVPYELFKHIQYNNEEPEFVSFIAAGMQMPLDELKSLYE
ncbi:MAG: hypothetical protein ACRDD7_06090, partial [Peptostreptococcaceae bacterium]